MAEELCEKGRWPAVMASVKYFGADANFSGQADQRQQQFRLGFFSLLDRLQESYALLSDAEKARCGEDGVAAEIFLQIDLSKKQVRLDKIFKYCEMDIHLFTELLEVLQNNFPDCDLMVPSLQGYDLAREIERFLGVPAIECIYLKGDLEERLLTGSSSSGPGFEDIMQDTARHYQERGGIETKRQELIPGTEISMFYLGPGGEEEVLWMQVRVPLSH